MLLGTFNALSAISILFVTTVGLAIIFGIMGVVNLAHGEFLMIGAYAGVLIANAGLSPWASLLFAPLLLAILAIVIEPILIRFLYGRTMESILATWGLGIVLRQLTELIFGRQHYQLPYVISGGIQLGDVQYSYHRLLIMAIAILLAVVLFWLQRNTDLGVVTRAVMSNSSLASSLGVNVNRVYRLAFAVGSAITGLGGALVAPLVSAYPSVGLNFVADSFLAILAGGTGSLFGLIGASSLLASVDSVVSYLADPVLGSILFVLLAVVVMTMRRSRA